MLQTANNNESGTITKSATRILPRKERTSTNSQAQPQKSEYYKDALRPVGLYLLHGRAESRIASINKQNTIQYIATHPFAGIWQKSSSCGF